MILTFSKKQFVERILTGVKVHTIREDKHNRWQPGRKIHFWYGNPRNTHAKEKPYHFATGECYMVDRISINSERDIFITNTNLKHPHPYDISTVSPQHDNLLKRVAINDVFDTVDDMFDWFKDKLPFTGKLIWFKVTELTEYGRNIKVCKLLEDSPEIVSILHDIDNGKSLSNALKERITLSYLDISKEDIDVLIKKWNKCRGNLIIRGVKSIKQ